MGSLPNLRSLSNDPNATYIYEIGEPNEPPRLSRSQLKSRPHFRFPVPGSNSQSDINKCRIVSDQNLRLVPHFLGNGHHHPQAEGGTSLQSKSRSFRKARVTRSSGSQYNWCSQKGGSPEDLASQLQLRANSPVPGRSLRSSCALPSSNILFGVGQNSVANRRRDSLSSSGGASSVRRLIAVVRSTPSRLGPIYSRRVLCRNFAVLCLGHATFVAALLPLLSLQSSISTWWWPFDSFRERSDVGSLLLSVSFAVASVFSLFSPCVIHFLGYNWTLVVGYMFASAFFIAHLYPTIRWLIPAYLLLGMSLGPIACARISHLFTLANKLTYDASDEEGDSEQMTGDAKDVVIQKLSRGLQASQDVGIVIGNAVTWLFLHHAQNAVQERDALDNLFEKDEGGDWICGSRSCPTVEDSFDDVNQNSTWGDGVLAVSCRTTALLASVFVGCGLVAMGLTAAFSDRIRLFVYQDPLERPVGIATFQAVKAAFKDSRLQLAAPLSAFIGLQQGFILADFSKWYVVCSLGISNVSLVFLSMGILQSIAAFTLSLLMQNVPRYLVIATGVIFHSCLLLVLFLWKPSGDDSALFYVIAAAWGVSNIIWEALNFTLLMHIYPDSTSQIAFVHGNFFKFLGLSIAFGLHGAACTSVKLYGLATAMVLGITSHVWLEIKLEARRKTKPRLTAL